MSAQVYLRPTAPLSEEQSLKFQAHCEKVGALPVPFGVEVLVPEYDRAFATSRRQAAVELLLGTGHKWENDTWVRPRHMLPLGEQLQQKCSDWGTYWRAPDAHGVNLSVSQALELLRDALGVEVSIDLHIFTNPVQAWFNAWETTFSDERIQNPGYTREERNDDYDRMMKTIREASP